VLIGGKNLERWKLLMSNNEIVIATITLARNDAESQRLTQAIAALAGHGFPVVAADGGSTSKFINGLQQFSNVTVRPYQPSAAPRLLSQVKNALVGAARLNPGCVLYTEPDKQWFFEHRLKTFVEQALAHTSFGVAIAARDEASFLTYPSFQYYTETVTAQLSAEVLGQEGDILYGPLLLSPTLLPYVESLTEDVGWGWRPFVMVVAQRLGLPVIHVTLDLPCPPEQHDEDDRRARLYRLEQLAQNAKGLALGARWPLEGS
jgi:hypothetical protein